MFLILPLSFILMIMLFANVQERYIDTYLKAIVIWCGLLFFQVELLSVFSMLNKQTVLGYWLVVCILLALMLKRKKDNAYKLRDITGRICREIQQNKFFSAVVCMTILLAIVTVPYNWDSMTYHVARIAHWAQNESIAHYATHNPRQVSTPGLHEFICLDIYLLSGNRDIFLNLVQGFAFLTNAWIIYEIARKLGVCSKYSKVGVLFFISMPIAFGEALTTQNDNLGAVFFLAYVYYILDFWRIEQRIEDNKATYGKCCTMGAIVGFGFLTKPTVSMGMLILAIMLLAICIRRKDSAKIIFKLILAVVPIIAIIIVPELIRNVITFGAILPSGTGARQLVGTLEPGYLLVNALKNFAFNLPTIYIPHSNSFLESALYLFAGVVGVDINAPSIAEDGRTFFLWGAGEFGHDTAVSSSVLLVSIVCLIWCVYRGKRTDSFKRLYTYVAFGLFIVFCMFVRWEPFVVRYMLPYLALMCPMIAVWIEDMSCNAKHEGVKNFALPISCWLGVTGLVFLFFYHGEIAKEQDFARADGYFSNRREIEADYRQAEEVIENAGYRNVGLIMYMDAYEYPIQYMLKYNVDWIEHIMVDNETAIYEDISFVPDCILTTSDMGVAMEVHEEDYEKVLHGEYLNVYVKVE